MHPKLPFLGQVFLNLIFQCSLALSLARNPLVEESARRNMLAYFIGSIGVILALAFAKASTPVRFIMLTLFSTLTGALMSLNKPSTEALEEVVRVFVALLVVGALSAALGLDLRTMYIVLFVALLALLFSRALTGMKMAKLGAFLFGLFVVVDTNAILQKNYEGDVVQATLDYFLDFVNLLSMMDGEDN
jgi:hypothetical protein